MTFRRIEYAIDYGDTLLGKSWGSYVDDENNRIAPSLAMHGFFDGFLQHLNIEVFCLKYPAILRSLMGPENQS